MKKNTRDLLFYVFECAKQDRLSFADAVSNDEKQQKKALSDVNAFEVLQKKIFGTSENKMNVAIRKAKNRIDIYGIKKLLDENPEIFIHLDGCECDYCKKNNSTKTE